MSSDEKLTVELAENSNENSTENKDSAEEDTEMSVEKAAEVLQEEIEDSDHDFVSTFLAEETSMSWEHLTAASTKRERPGAVAGHTQKINTGYGGMYVTINEDNEGLFELFAKIGKSGGYTESFTEALGRLISLALQRGVPPEKIVHHLDGIRSPKVGWDGEDQIHSVPDGIATAMERHMDGEITNDSDDLSSTNQSSDEGSDSVDGTRQTVKNGANPECPQCGAVALYYSEGCKTCEACGWSEC